MNHRYISENVPQAITPQLIDNRRTGSRISLDRLITCQNSHLCFLAHVKDIGLQGLSGFGNSCPPEGSYLNLCFGLPGPYGSIECQGIVIRSSPKGDWAVQFVHPVKTQGDPLKYFIERKDLTGNA